MWTSLGTIEQCSPEQWKSTFDVHVHAAYFLCRQALPILRKDFIIDEYQLYEARVMLADCALLIVRILDKVQLRDYIALAREELKLSTLVEVHSEKELDVALDA